MVRKRENMVEKKSGFWRKREYGRVPVLQRSMPLLREWLVILLNFCHFAVLFIIICGLFGVRHIQVLYLCILAVFPFLLYGIRWRIEGAAKFILLHLAALAVWGFFLYLGTASLTERIVAAIILIFYECYSFYLRGEEGAGKETVLPPALSVGLFASALFLQNLMGATEFQPLLAGLTVAYLCMYFVHYYLDNYLDFVKVNRIGAGKFQGRKILHSGLFATGAYIVFSAAVLAVCTNPSLGNWLGRGLTALLRLLLSGIKGSGGVVEEEPETEFFADQTPMPPDNLEAGEPGIFWEILDKVLGILVFFLVLAVFAISVIAVVRWIQRLFGNRYHEAVLEGDSHIQDVTESLERNTGKKVKRQLFYGWTNNGRIRKAYAGFMKSRKKQLEERLAKELSHSTARECVQALELKEVTVKEEENRIRLIRIYEQARYSGKECGNEDMNRFKHTLSRFREKVR